MRRKRSRDAIFFSPLFLLEFKVFLNYLLDFREKRGQETFFLYFFILPIQRTSRNISHLKLLLLIKMPYSSLSHLMNANLLLFYCDAA